VVTIGFLQYSPARHDVAANIAAVHHLAEGARVDLLVLPELASCGYMYASPAELLPLAEPGDGSGQFLSALRGLAAGMGSTIVAGFAELAPEGLYNSAAAVDGSGVIQLYRKTHLFWNEVDLFLPGNTGFRVCDSRMGRLGMMICFDWYFPEAARTLMLRGAQIIAHPSNLVLPWCQAAMLTRCLENHVYAVTANRHGVETLGSATLAFTGGSQIVDPQGRRLEQAASAGDALGLCEIDLDRADDKQISPRNRLLEDRRPEMYA
jgi:5-aminopentanamidase